MSFSSQVRSAIEIGQADWKFLIRTFFASEILCFSRLVRHRRYAVVVATSHLASH